MSADDVRIGKCRLYGGTPPCPDADESCRTACAQHADDVRTTIRTRRGKILGWHWSFFYWDGMYRVHWWRQSDGEVDA